MLDTHVDLMIYNTASSYPLLVKIDLVKIINPDHTKHYISAFLRNYVDLIVYSSE